MPDNDLRQIDEYVKLLTNQQRSLFVYIYSLVADESQANDILQNTNEVLWSKRAEFTPGTSFTAWASRIAYWQVMDYAKRKQIDRHLFDTDLLDEVAQAVAETTAQADSRLLYLDECLGELPREHRQVIRQRYEPGVSVADLARQQGSSTTALSQLLYRIRHKLLDCIEGKLAREVSP